MAALLGSLNPDVAAAKTGFPGIRTTTFGSSGWHFRRDDELFVASRYPIRGAERLAADALGGGPGYARDDLEVAASTATTSIPTISTLPPALPPSTLITIYNVHLATPRHALEQAMGRDPAVAGELAANSALRCRQSEAASRSAAGVRHPVLLAGDFNTPPESAAFQDFGAIGRSASIEGCWSRRAFRRGVCP